MTYLERQLRRLERRVSDLEERLNQPTNPSEAWLRKMADAEDQAGSVFAGCPPCDVNADLESGFGELQRKLDAGEAIESTSAKILVKTNSHKSITVDKCPVCDEWPSTYVHHGRWHINCVRHCDSVGETLEQAAYFWRQWCEQLGGEYAESAKKPMPPESDHAEQPTIAREWWVVISHLGSIVRHYRDHSFAKRDVKKIPNCRIARVVLVPTREERELAYANMTTKFGRDAADYMDEIVDSFFGPAES